MTAEAKAKQICELQRLQAQISIAIRKIELNELLVMTKIEFSHHSLDSSNEWFIIGDFIISKRSSSYVIPPMC